MGREKNYIDTYIFNGKDGGFIFSDLKRAIDIGLNYLAALGLMSYTEFIGGLIPPFTSRIVSTGGMSGKQKNFYNFYYRLGTNYQIFDRRLRRWFQNGVYNIYRGGLIHKYFIGGNVIVRKQSINFSSVVTKSSNSALGITKDGKLGFAINPYFNDFVEVMRLLRTKILVDKDQEWVNFFNSSAGLKRHFIKLK